MNKKRAVLVLGLVASTILLTVGATMALFTDAVQPVEAEFTAGRLKITSMRNDGDTITGPCFYVTAEQGKTPTGVPGHLPTGIWAPGDSHSRTLQVFNNSPGNPVMPGVSTMDAWITSVKATLQAGSDAILAGELYVVVQTPKAGTTDYTKVAEGYLDDFIAGQTVTYPDGSKVPCWLDGNRPLKFTVSFDQDADNDCQGKHLVVDFTVSAEQMPHNP